MVKEKIEQVWPEWEVEKLLGQGSYGVVYQALRRDSGFQNRAAIKVISIPSGSELASVRAEGMNEDNTRTYFKEIVDGFVDEIRLMESLKGTPNIVGVEDYKVVERTDEIGWDIYIRMELLTPFNRYTCDKQLAEQDVIKLGVDICTALEYCARLEVVHRDIKPENIFINDFQDYKLGDFGIARKLENATGGLSQKGTFNYMAPEVATGTKYDARVDIYSLGIVMYRLLNQNRMPFLENEQQMMSPSARKSAVERRISGEQLPPPCNASQALAEVVLRACAYRPADRFANAKEMKEALLKVKPQQSAESVIPDADIDVDKTVSVRRAAFAGGNTPKQQTVVVNNYDHTGTEKINQPPVRDVNKRTEEPANEQVSAKKKRNKYCVFALITAVLFLVGNLICPHGIGLLPAFLPVTLAIIGRGNTKRTNTKGNGMALTALFMGLLIAIYDLDRVLVALDRVFAFGDTMVNGLRGILYSGLLVVVIVPYIASARAGRK